ncbi:fibronectin type III domain-containing protein, partial [Flavobacterium sp. RHBU_24]|uniref:fibronectin type III domain-containing protein n=1 Tax=Flavobacterium sp. RHBU_24 TaxID=3391185 RepID=UPI003984ED53
MVLKTTVKNFLTAFLLVLTAAFYGQQPGDLDLTFNGHDNVYVDNDAPSLYNGANGTVYTSALQPDGKVIIAGDFTTYRSYPKNRIVRILANGSIDPTFDPGLGADGIIYSVALQADGKIVIGGAFTTYGGEARNYIARLNADGSLDSTFVPGTGGNNYVQAVAVQADGKILAGGLFTMFNGFSANRIVRLASSGDVDDTFTTNTGASAIVRAIAIQNDNKILIAGDFTTYNGTTRNRIARLTTTGTLDTTFAPASGANSAIYSVNLQTDGKILIGGSFTTFNGTSRKSAARINTDGSLDTTFTVGTGGNDIVRYIMAQTDGKILVGGNFTYFSGIVNAHRLARLLSNGVVDTAFTTGSGYGPADAVYSIVQRADGKLVVTGAFVNYNIKKRDCVAAINTDGSLDLGFNNISGVGSGNYLEEVALQPDGKILLAGSITQYNEVPYNRIVRTNSDGSIDTSFNIGTGADGSIGVVVVQPNGKILIGGDFTHFNGVSRNKIARLNADGSLDTTFTPSTGFNNTVRSIVLQPDGAILVGGDFTTFGGSGSEYLVRLYSDGGSDSSFNFASSTSSAVHCIALQPDGKILIGGYFSTSNGVARKGISRLNSNGTLDTTFNPGTGSNDLIYSIALQADGKILLGGAFTNFNNTSANKLVRLTTTGAIDSTFQLGSGANSSGGVSSAIREVTVLSDSKILINGYFNSYNGFVSSRLARLNSDGSVDTAFYAGNDSNDVSIQHIAIQPDNKILAAGYFTSYKNVRRYGIARIYNMTGCSTPVNLLGTALTSTSASVRWEIPNGSTPTAYEYAVTTSATPPASGTVVTDTAVPASITPGIPYYLHVRAVCDTSYSYWATSAPFQYYTGTIPGDTCANAINLATLTSPYNDTTIGSNNDYYNGYCGMGDYAPEKIFYINVPNGSALTIAQTANNYNAQAYVGWGSPCDAIPNIIGCVGDDTTPQVWSNTTGSTQTVYWIQDGNGVDAGTFTLSWSVVVTPVCGTPTAPAATSVGATVATMAWTAATTGPPTGYQVYYATSPTAPLAGAAISSTTNTTNYTAALLTPATTYYWWVRAVCGSTAGAWVAGGSYTTSLMGCTTGGLYPAATYTPACTGAAETIVTNAYAGEYSSVILSANTNYTFSSSVTTDFITITNSTGTTVLAYGTTPLVWNTGENSGNFRYYFHTNSACGTQNT